MRAASILARIPAPCESSRGSSCRSRHRGRRCRHRSCLPVLRVTAAAAAAEGGSRPPTAVVVGAGVVGLTTAVRLLQSGFDTHVVADKAAEESVSVGAGAIWECPPFKASPLDACCAWALASKDVFDALGKQRGVFQRRTHYLWENCDACPADALAPAPFSKDFRAGEPPQEVGSRYAVGWSHLVPILDMPSYLPFLRSVCIALGGTIQTTDAPLRTLEDGIQAVTSQHGGPTVVVNCTGLGAASLTDVADPAVIPVRGIKVYVHAPDVRPVDVYIVEPRDTGTSFTSITPRGDTGVWACSGVAQPGATSLEVTAEEVEAIMARCVDLLPALKGRPVTGAWAGLRPLRQAAAGGIRVAAERMASGTLAVHNYGHGGAGVVTSWGCANDVAALAAAEAVAQGHVLRAVTAMPAGFADVPLPRRTQ